MPHGLIQYNRDMNRVFGACIAIQNTARSLDATMLEMELLARNGVAKAARLSAGHGRPLLVLAEILAGLPADMRKEVAALDRKCRDLTRTTADSSNHVRLYHQLVRALIDLAERTAREGRRTLDGRVTTAAFTRRAELDALTACITADAVTVRNRDRIADRCALSLDSVARGLAEATRTVRALDEEFDRLRTIGLTARYLAQHIEIETSQIDASAEAFVTLAQQIHAAIDHLERVLVELRQTARDGADRLNDLRERMETA